MPSYRVIVSVGALRPGVSPQAVEPAAAAAAGERTVVEASSVDIVAREARLTVRFVADTAAEAVSIAEHTVERIAALAEPTSWRLTERVGGRWFRRA
ncbi:hypothetical protein IT072_14370 [Leifsonia sp. ZF2019]|uniref:hypothetical protein n=1 Tax=Leifsonia sp. ZF2019 TaxID=2781978 RepID=UPI001CBA7D24|nr:hypothetical protein [Leifsonia sp. ZF2019]UAJ78438.1 hypothetical protein IT072_14370 [Leifsonia sp. ZF2019]